MPQAVKQQPGLDINAEILKLLKLRRPDPASTPPGTPLMGNAPAEAQAAQWYASKRSQRAMLEDLVRKGGADKNVLASTGESWIDAPGDVQLARRFKAWGIPEQDPTKALPQDVWQQIWDELMFDKSARGPDWRSVAGGRTKDQITRKYSDIYDKGPEPESF